MAKKQKPHIKIVFDTNVLYTGSCSDLINRKTKEFISKHSSFEDIEVSWFIPEVVINEREYQMREKGEDLLPSIQKMEKLLGHNLNITDEIIKSRVKDAIQDQMKTISISALPIEVENIDWKEVIKRSSFRKPPFDSGENEKGFRDVIIAESFMQLINSSPTTPRICRVVMITGDNLLRSYLEEKTNECKNVKIINELEDLSGFINTLASEVTIEFIDSIIEQVQKYFFVPKDDNTLYYKENIDDKIKNLYKIISKENYHNSDFRQDGTWYISNPRFLKKTGQRITWKTQVSIETKCYKWITKESSTPRRLGLTSLQPKSSFTTLLGGNIEQRLLASGDTIFEVIWTITISTNKKIHKPKIEEIKFVKNQWEEKNSNI